MKAVIQRVKEASVSIEGQLKSEIGVGLLVLLGVSETDTENDLNWLVQKIVKMRIFGDDQGKMNLSLMDVNASMLVVSQFTLHANGKKGNRPSFVKAAKPDLAIPMYEMFVKRAEELTNKSVVTGEFGADMQISLLNDGPVTIIMDTENKEG